MVSILGRIILILINQIICQPTACSVHAAGIESSAIIEEHQLTASSRHPHSVYEPRDGRLHSTTGAGWLMSHPYRGNLTRVRLVCVSNVR